MKHIERCPKCGARAFNGAACYNCGYKLPRILTIAVIFTVASVIGYALSAGGLL